MMENYTMFYVFIMNIVQLHKYLLSTSYMPGMKNAIMHKWGRFLLEQEVLNWKKNDIFPEKSRHIVKS